MLKESLPKSISERPKKAVPNIIFPLDDSLKIASSEHNQYNGAMQPKGFLPYYQLMRRRKARSNPRTSKEQQPFSRNSVARTSKQSRREFDRAAPASIVNYSTEFNTEQQWKEKVIEVLTQLNEEKDKYDKIVLKNSELALANQRMMALMTAEQRELLKVGATKLKDEFSVTCGDVHMMYQNYYIKDLKDQIAKLKAVNEERRMQVRILEKKLEEANTEVLKLKTKLRIHYNMLRTSKMIIRQSPDATTNNIHCSNDRKSDKSISFKLNKINKLLCFLNELGKCEGISQVCESVLS
eukprot:TRINITY_DN10642_c0_g1_i12.p1 TRINITY_DN10642_c0_g1~~TRINITY_DN10642_c0_g1_i12.p1  ORF type:complete len:296 (+),score=55.67 TRINITY_DN10642_c0_g1_i12:138-1025(+)